MSETETHIGKAKLLPQKETLTLEQRCKDICDQEGYTITKHHESYRELLWDRGYEKYIIVKQDIYQILEDSSEDDINSIKENPDGTLDYVLQYHNGGCSFSEAFKWALEKIGK